MKALLDLDLRLCEVRSAVSTPPPLKLCDDSSALVPSESIFLLLSLFRVPSFSKLRTTNGDAKREAKVPLPTSLFSLRPGKIGRVKN